MKVAFKTIFGPSELYLSSHALEQLNARCFPDLTESEIRDWLFNIIPSMVYIDDRPTNLTALLNNKGKSAYYLYDSLAKVVLVVEKSRSINRLDEIVTAYDSNACGWLQVWNGKTPGNKRKIFRDIERI